MSCLLSRKMKNTRLNLVSRMFQSSVNLKIISICVSYNIQTEMQATWELLQLCRGNLEMRQTTVTSYLMSQMI